MRKLWLGVLLFIIQQGGFTMILPQDQLMEALAIRIPGNEKAQYVYGDNIKGYFEGYTSTYQKGEGYKLLNSALYKDFASFHGNTLNNRKSPQATLLYPYGVRTLYEAGHWDEFILHNREYLISLQVHADNPEQLRILPLLTSRDKSTEVKMQGKILLLSPAKPPKSINFPVYMAISSPQDFSWSMGDREKDSDLKDSIRIAKGVVAPILQSRKKITDFTVYISFGYTPEEAVLRARQAAADNTTARQKTRTYDFLTRSYFWTDDMDFNRAVMWSKLSAYSLVSEEYGWGIWAGLPWFKDNWGRDTFIALPGTLLVSGQFNTARDVLTNFSVFQNRGTQYLTLNYKNDEEKDAIKDYIKNHWGSGIKTKKGSGTSGTIGHSVNRYYLDHPTELTAKLDRMKKDLPGITFELELIINQEYGRIPNRVSGDSIIYNTTDGTPWLIREAWEYLRYSGDAAFKKEIYPVIRLALDGAVTNYADQQGFLTHADADTWMDARIAGAEPWSARGNRAVEIQALWYTSLRIGEALAREMGEPEKARQYQALADKLRTSFPALFWDTRNKVLADRITEKNRPDYKVRPNQLMVISVPFEDRLLDSTTEAWVVKNAVSRLLFPYGIASLDPGHPYFHPYHEMWDNYHKDAAYHNGTVWGWNAGPTVSALTRFNYTELAYRLSQNLSHQILYQGCRGSMSEVMDAVQSDPLKLKLTGTYSQAWSVSEFARNAYQDYAGFQPDLLSGTVTLAPSTPEAWTNTYARLSFGLRGEFHIQMKRSGSLYQYTVWYQGYEQALRLKFAPAFRKGRLSALVELQPGQKRSLVFDSSNGTLNIDGKPVTLSVLIADQSRVIGTLDFIQPDPKRVYPMLKDKNILEQIIKNGKFE